MAASQTFQDLVVWQKAHAFVLGVYEASKSFPKEELYGLTSQFRRAAVSVPANIAEGSLEECRYYLILSRDLNYSNNPDLWALSEEVGKLLHSYRRAILNSNR